MHDIVEVVENLSKSVPEDRSFAELRENLSHLRRVRAWIDSVEARVVSALEAIPTAMPAIELARSGLKSSDVRRIITRAEAIETAPLFAEALDEGRVTAAHVDAFAGALKIMGEDSTRLIEAAPRILRDAERLSPDDFARKVRRTARRLLDDGGIDALVNQKRRTCLRSWVDDEGMTVLHGRFDPERGAVVTSLLDQAVEAIFHSGDRDSTVDVASGLEPNDHRRAIALVAIRLSGLLVAGSSFSNRSPGRTPTVCMIAMPVCAMFSPEDRLRSTT